jgi:hypothetical protein
LNLARDLDTLSLLLYPASIWFVRRNERVTWVVHPFSIERECEHSVRIAL